MWKWIHLEPFKGKGITSIGLHDNQLMCHKWQGGFKSPGGLASIHTYALIAVRNNEAEAEVSFPLRESYKVLKKQ